MNSKIFISDNADDSGDAGAGDAISQSNSSLPDRRKKNNYTKSFPGFWMLANSWSTSKDNDGNTVITLTDDATVHGDVFAAGCLFFYFITRGLHPFEDPDGRGSILINIKNKNAASLNSINFTLKIYQYKLLNLSTSILQNWTANTLHMKQ